MRLIHFSIIILLTIYSFNCDKTKDQSQIKGNLTFVLGSVEISNKSGNNPAKKDTSVGEGDTIKTGPKSVAVIQFENNGTAIELQENAEFSISKFNTKEQELVSTKGNFWLKAKKVNKESNFNVVMPTSVAGIRGTSLYSFEIKEFGVTGICHCQGAVDFQDKQSGIKEIHDTDYAVLTKDGKTIIITPKDFGINESGHEPSEHNHSAIDNSPVGKKANSSDTEQFMRIKQIAMQKFAEK